MVKSICIIIFIKFIIIIFFFLTPLSEKNIYFYLKNEDNLIIIKNLKSIEFHIG